MSRGTIPTVTGGVDFGYASWANQVKANDEDHETRVVAVEGANTEDVTLAGTPNYLTIIGQVITRALINLASHVTGRLPFANLTAATAASRLLGRGSASGAGDFQELTLGSSLALAGTVLDVTLGLYRATVTLTDAQIKALPTTPITIVAAPGSGLALLPLYGGLFSKTTSGAYTNIDAAGYTEVLVGASALILATVPNDAAITNGSTTRLTQLLGSTTPRYAPLVPYMDTEDVDQWGPIPHLVDTAAITDLPMTIDISNGGSGNLTGGNAANALKVVVFYAIEAVP